MIELDEHRSERMWLDLTPMIDVVFLLLLFFLLTSMYARPQLPLDLPQSETALTPAESDVHVAIKADGSIHLNGEKTGMKDLSGELARIYGVSGKRELALASDKGVPFGLVVEVMDAARKAGAEDISIVTDKKR
ncbi:MAG: biopolymer transporter ExbD [Deltaproteobacteria bacterium]|nr:biopolymer transporter ExbD [Deltaproteobacteria bacterium]MCL4873882.1 biopolymer transporter ExbD [bacterium]